MLIWYDGKAEGIKFFDISHRLNAAFVSRKKEKQIKPYQLNGLLLAR